MRELRVEDALLYLDQVKVEFGDRPQIYNEFLEIMKTFKTQQIDTPGVIRRVSNLFQGNRKLVLGFNTFLPEGYKIELPEGNGPPVATYRAPGDTVTHVITGPGATFFPMGIPGDQPARPGDVGGPPSEVSIRRHSSTNLAGTGPPNGAPQAVLSQNGQLPPHHPAAVQGRGAPSMPSHAQLAGAQEAAERAYPGMESYHGGGMRPGGPGFQHMRQGDADAAANQPEQQHQQQQQDHGHLHQQQQPQPPAMQQPQQPPPGAQQQQPPPVAQQQQQQQQQPGAGHAAGAAQPPMEFDHAINYVTTIKKRFAGEPETYKKFLEILHTYQKEQRGIKEVLDEVSVLFSEHPDLLKQFTFFLPDAVQAQAKAQLDQVAKESEARKRAASSKQAIMNQAQGMRRGQMQPAVQAPPPPPPPPPVQPVRHVREHPPPPPRPPRAPVAAPAPAPPQPQAPIPFGATMGRSAEREWSIHSNSVFGKVSFAPVRPPRQRDLSVKEAAAKKGRPTMLPPLPIQPTTAETAFFERAKKHLNRKELAPDKPAGSRRHTPHTEFLKCLHLFGAGVLNKDELVLLLRGLFIQGHAPKSGVNAGGGACNPSIADDAHELIREFEEILVGRGPYAKQEMTLRDKSKYGSIRTHDFDFQNCERPTPSYVSYPDDYPRDFFISNTGQTEEDAKVLNSKYICLAYGKHRHRMSPEDYDGVRARRNTYEEVMFRIEDERFEMDMAIERNASAMRQMEPIAQEVSKLREVEEKDGQPIGRLQYNLKGRTFKSIQINAIGRIYGEHGDEIIEHLSRNPLAVLPIVYQRLRQKDSEWRKVKLELSEKWREIQDSNYEGSFDHQCFFRSKEKESAFMPDVLLDECQDVRSYLNDGEKQKDTGAEFALACMDTTALMFQPHLSIQLDPNSMSHFHAVQLLIPQVIHRTSRNMSDRERIGRIWSEFVIPFFEYPPEWVAAEVRNSSRGKSSSNVVHFAKGQRVQTAYGEGTIVGYSKQASEAEGHYKVKLGYGMGTFSPSAILHGISDTDKTTYIRKNGAMVLAEGLYKGRGQEARLDKRFKVLFGSQSVYLFMRLFSMLISILENLELTIKPIDSASEASSKYYNPSKTQEAKASITKLDFMTVVTALKKVVKGTMEPKQFETLCRRVTKTRVHDLVALPKLVEKCANTLVHVGKEDLLLTLHDYGQFTGMDPAQVRAYSLAISKDASYRIQYDMDDGKLFFSYVPEGERMITAPPQGLGPGDMDMDVDDNYDDDDDDDDDDDSLHVEYEEEDLRAAKRRRHDD